MIQVYLVLVHLQRIHSLTWAEFHFFINAMRLLYFTIITEYVAVTFCAGNLAYYTYVELMCTQLSIGYKNRLQASWLFSCITDNPLSVPPERVLQ